MSTCSVMTLNNLVVKALTWGEGIPSFYSMSQNYSLYLHAQNTSQQLVVKTHSSDMADVSFEPPERQHT